MAEMLQPAGGLNSPTSIIQLAETGAIPPTSRNPQQNVSENELLSPLGTINWLRLAPTLASAALLVLLFTGVVTLWQFTVNWLVKFDVGWAVCIVVLLAGVLSIVPRI